MAPPHSLEREKTTAPPIWTGRVARSYAILLVLAFVTQLLRVLYPRELPPETSRWESIWVPVLYNLLPIFVGAVAFWFWLHRRSVMRVKGFSFVRHVEGFAVFALVDVAAALASRAAYGHAPSVIATTIDFWWSVMITLPFWYVIFALMATFAFENERVATAAAEREQLIEARRVAENRRLAAELRMLRTYVQPHFLFNTLNAIASLIDVAPARARQAIVTTADLLRASMLADPNDDLVSLDDELTLVRRYLAIEQLRMEQRLQTAFAIDGTYSRAMVPRFTLQVLVENAVRHGIFPKPHGGTVSLGVAPNEEMLVVTVSDDGVGANPADISATTGLGLRSIRERLHAAFGDRSSVSIDTTPGAGFVATLRIPREPYAERPA